MNEATKKKKKEKGEKERRQNGHMKDATANTYA
jgi:hypothetical protein